MTDHQADMARNDLLDLIIEKIKRIVTDEDERNKLISEINGLKKVKPQ